MAEESVPSPAWVPPRWVPPARRNNPWVVLGAALAGILTIVVLVALLPDPGPPAPFDSGPPVKAFDPLPDELAPSSPVSSFDNGTYKVGRDVKPGTYRANPSPSHGQLPCTWNTRSIADGRIEKQGEGPDGHVVELELGTLVLSSGCGTWTRTDPPLT